jgi:hypothetical protein
VVSAPRRLLRQYAPRLASPRLAAYVCMISDVPRRSRICTPHASASVHTRAHLQFDSRFDESGFAAQVLPKTELPFFSRKTHVRYFRRWWGARMPSTPTHERPRRPSRKCVCTELGPRCRGPARTGAHSCKFVRALYFVRIPYRSHAVRLAVDGRHV